MTRMAGQLTRMPIWAFGGARTTPSEIQDVIARIARKHVNLGNLDTLARARRWLQG
jgi:hypothetical protein